MTLPKVTVGTIVKLFLASLCVGLILAYFGKDPWDIIAWGQDTVQNLVGSAAEHFQTALKYVLLGAVVVVPVWLLHYLWRALRGKG